MKRFLKLFTGCLCAVLITILCPQTDAGENAPERIVILAPAAADIVALLGAAAEVVGVTDSIDEFPQAKRVGTHINPSIEVIASLKPTVIICTERFSLEQAKRMKVQRFVYAPADVADIPDNIYAMGAILHRREAAGEILNSIRQKLSQLEIPEKRLTAVFEVRSNPLSLAGQETIASGALKLAGMHNVFGLSRTSSVSPEFVISSDPDFYIYQNGPMNLNAVHPMKRPGWRELRSCVVQVNEKKFSRANTKLYDEILRINKAITGDNPCGALISGDINE